MRLKITLLSIIFILFLTSCQSTGKRYGSKPSVFYVLYSDLFLNSDLVHYEYNPRTQFAFIDTNSSIHFRVLILKDSSLRVFGMNDFSQYFGIDSYAPPVDDVIISKLDSLYLVSDAYQGETYRIKIEGFSNLNVLDYFMELKRELDKYQIIEISHHPQVNTIKIVFSENEYLIYKPDSLLFNSSNRDFMSSLFENAKELDKNWYLFNEKIDADYY